MHLARRTWCRTYQMVFRIVLPILPYTEPRILEHAEDVPAVLQKRSIQKVLIVTDPGIARLGLTASLERALTAQGIWRCGLCRNISEPHGFKRGRSGVPVQRKVPGSVQTALRVSLRHLPEKQQPSGRVYPRRHGRQP